MAEHLPFIQRENRYASAGRTIEDERVAGRGLGVSASRSSRLAVADGVAYASPASRAGFVLISSGPVASGEHFVFHRWARSRGGRTARTLSAI